MLKILRTFNGQTWCGAALLLVLGAVCTPTFHADTQSYLDHAIVRAPGYPLLLDAAQLLAGLHWPRLITLLQGALAGWTMRHLTLALRARFAIPPGLALFLGALAALPQLVWIPSLLTESVGHSLFLVLLAALLRATLTQPVRQFAIAALALALSIAIRPHFVFVGPVLWLPALALAWQARSRRLAVQLCGLTLGAVLAGTCGQVLGNGVTHGLPVRSAALGMHAAAVQLYLATPQELATLQQPGDQAIVAPLGRFMLDKRLFSGSVPGATDTVDGFNLAFDGIIYAGLVPQARVRLGHEVLTAADWLELDRGGKHLAARLARQHQMAFVRHVAQQLYAGGALLVLTLASVLWGAWTALRRQSPEGLLLATVSVLALANHLEVALVQVTRMRYVMSTDLALVVVVLAIVGRERTPGLDAAPDARAPAPFA